MTDHVRSVMDRGSRNRNRYAGFLKDLKKKKKLPLDTMFRDAHNEAFSQIDCLDCGLCCSNLGPRINNRDISRLSRRERIKPAVFIEKYLRVDEDGDFVFRSMPCPFLGPDFYCHIYEDRPDACRNYPHLNQGKQIQRINSHIENISYCPAVILAVESLMEDSRIT